MRRTNTFKAMALGLLLAASALPAAAQLGPTLPASVVESASVGSAERSSIDAYVAALTPDAIGTDAEKAAAARTALVKPLRENRPSVSFRQAYARSAADLISKLLASDEPARIAGLRLAGNLATGDTARTIADALKDPDAGVRVFAGVQARRVFEVSSQNGPALTDSQSSQLVASLSAALTASQDRIISETLIRALSAAAQSTTQDMTASRTAAAIALGNDMSARVRATSPSDLPAIQDPILIASSSLTQTMSNPSATASNDAAKAAAGFGGDVLAALLTREIQGMNDAAPSDDVRLLRAAESLVYFARRRQLENANANAGSIPQTNLAGLLESGSRDFRRELVALIGPGSRMLAQFGFADDRFVK